MYNFLTNMEDTVHYKILNYHISSNVNNQNTMQSLQTNSNYTIFYIYTYITDMLPNHVK